MTVKKVSETRKINFNDKLYLIKTPDKYYVGNSLENVVGNILSHPKSSVNAILIINSYTLTVILPSHHEIETIFSICNVSENCFLYVDKHNVILLKDLTKYLKFIDPLDAKPIGTGIRVRLKKNENYFFESNNKNVNIISFDKQKCSEKNSERLYFTETFAEQTNHMKGNDNVMDEEKSIFDAPADAAVPDAKFLFPNSKQNCSDVNEFPQGNITAQASPHTSEISPDATVQQTGEFSGMNSAYMNLMCSGFNEQNLKQNPQNVGGQFAAPPPNGNQNNFQNIHHGFPQQYNGMPVQYNQSLMYGQLNPNGMPMPNQMQNGMPMPNQMQNGMPMPNQMQNSMPMPNQMQNQMSNSMQYNNSQMINNYQNEHYQGQSMNMQSMQVSGYQSSYSNMSKKVDNSGDFYKFRKMKMLSDVDDEPLDDISDKPKSGLRRLFGSNK